MLEILFKNDSIDGKNVFLKAKEYNKVNAPLENVSLISGMGGIIKKAVTKRDLPDIQLNWDDR